MLVEVGGLGGGPGPMAARLPSPWDPLLISPWEGEGNGSRERGHVVVGEGTSAMWVVGAVREPPLRVGLRERRRVVVGDGVLR